MICKPKVGKKYVVKYKGSFLFIETLYKTSISPDINAFKYPFKILGKYGKYQKYKYNIGYDINLLSPTGNYKATLASKLELLFFS